MLHVYGIIDDSRIRGVLPRGHGGGALAALPADGLAAVVSEAASASIDVSVAHVWHHEKVLNALMKRHAVLPMRFGTVRTADELSSLLGRRRNALRAALQELVGKVEMAVRIAWVNTSDAQEGKRHPGNHPAAPSGKAYLMALAERRGRVSAEDTPAFPPGTDLRKCLERLSAATVWHEPEGPGRPLKVSCLVARDKVDVFVDCLDAWERDHLPNLRVSCTGPWAPYSFVGRRAALGGEG